MKKCGVIERMTLGLLILLIFMVAYVYVSFTKTHIVSAPSYPSNRILDEGVYTDGHPRLRNDPFRDPYSPPLKDPYFPSGSGTVNIQTRGSSYTQLGILTRSTDILPLMGRRLNGRDKYQYYTISNMGNLNTKLPIRVKGRSGTNEYGCDEIYSNDTVYVDGYNDSFRVTIYENGQFTYIPVL